jgi:hypothetical protein
MSGKATRPGRYQGRKPSLKATHYTINWYRPSNPHTFTHLLSRNLPLPKYFSSPPSFALYRLPRKNPHAFQQAIGTAAGKAGVTSLRVNPDEPDEELSERFVVGWIEVDVASEPVPPKETVLPVDERRPFPGGIGMGTREDRRSFGSDGTSRTVTPTPPRFGRDTPTPPTSRKVSGTVTNTRTTLARSDSQNKTPRARVNTTEISKPPTQKERQLVAITYSGDWYRLKIPESRDGGGDEEPEEDDKVKKGRCQLVEYRRLGVGGSGW